MEVGDVSSILLQRNCRNEKEKLSAWKVLTAESIDHLYQYLTKCTVERTQIF